MEVEHQGEEETVDDKEPPEEPTKVYDFLVGSLSGRTLIEEVGVEIQGLRSQSKGVLQFL
jgi:hypothetical protein